MTQRRKQASISHFFQVRPKNHEPIDKISIKKIIPVEVEDEEMEENEVTKSHDAEEQDKVEEQPKEEQAKEEDHKELDLQEVPVKVVVNSTSKSITKPTAKSSPKSNPKSTKPPKSTPKSKAKRVTELESRNVVKRKKTTTLTPLEKQIIELKEENPGKLLLIQVGYKYKLFGEDARIGAKILNIMFIPGGDDEKGEQFSYCSFPDFKLHINLKRILNHGHKVGVVKQMESSIAQAVGKTSRSDVMKREITGVYTRGTYMSDEFIYNLNNSNSGGDVENPDYIICIYESKNEFAIVASQPITGEIIYDTFTDDTSRSELETRLLYLHPSEVVVVNNEKEISKSTLKTLNIVNNQVSIQHHPAKSLAVVLEDLTQFFASIDDGKHRDLVEYYSVNFASAIQICINELIQYLAEFQLSNIFTIPQNISIFTNSKKYMILPSNTLNALEIFQNFSDPNSTRGSLIWLLDHARTRFGKRLLHKWISRPLIQRDIIENRLQAIEDLSSDFNQAVDALKNYLTKIGKSLDLEELLIKTHYSATYSTNKISRRELYLMLECFDGVMTLTKKLCGAIDELEDRSKSPLLTEIFADLKSLSKTDIVGNFLQMINPNYTINESKDPEEQKVQYFNLNYHDWEGISGQLKEISQIEELLEDELERIKKVLKRSQLKYVTNNREPYLIEVRNGKAVDELTPDFQRINGTTTVSRFRTQEVIRLYKLLQYHKELLGKNCDSAFNDFLGQVDENYIAFNKLIKNLATFDCLLSLTAASSINSGYSRPKLVEEQTIDVVKCRNPIIENLVGSHYVANDISIKYNKDRVLIITGPNMGGKSSYVKQVALIVILTQIGCYIPCQSATLGIFDSIFVRMGANDNILKGNSTFMTEMLECSTIIQHMSSKSLIILDEIGRGTGTTDGIAIAYSILRYLVESPLKPLVLFITHYPSLHTLEETYSDTVTNYHMGFQKIDNDQEFPEIIFLYNLVKGVVKNLYGLNVAKMASLPNSIISKAFAVSEELKNKIEVENLERFSTTFLRVIKSVTDEATDISKQKLEELFKYI